jgi:hypothetical protein
MYNFVDKYCNKTIKKVLQFQLKGGALAYSLSIDEQSFLRLFRSVSPAIQRAVIAMLEEQSTDAILKHPDALNLSAPPPSPPAPLPTRSTSALRSVCLIQTPSFRACGAASALAGRTRRGIGLRRGGGI